MKYVVEHTLEDEDLRRKAEQVLKEVVTDLATHLNRRRRTSRGPVKESAFLQLAALGALYEVTLERYPKQFQDAVEELALKTAAHIRANTTRKT